MKKLLAVVLTLCILVSGITLHLLAVFRHPVQRTFLTTLQTGNDMPLTPNTLMPMTVLL